MLVEFSVGNFCSFKDIQTLSMVAAPISSKNKELDEYNTFQATPKLKLLKTKAIYGANGSGKSNLVNAMMRFVSLIKDSLQENTFKALFNNPFLFSTESKNQPSFFQIIFIVKGILYRYGYETNETGIISEWLFATPNQREVNYFLRDGQKLDINEKHLKGAKKIQNLLGDSSPIFKNTSLFFTVLASLNNLVILELENYFKNLFIDIQNGDITSLEKAKRNISISTFIDGNFKESTINLLKFADSGIESIGTVTVTNNGEDEKVIAFTANLFNDEKKQVGQIPLHFFMFASEGTKRIFDVSPFIHNSLENGLSIFIDEFDSKLHPIITKKIVELYHKNENQAQLIFVTHDTNLLDSRLLRRDQIAFIEKDKFGASHLYDLVEFKGVRNDASYEKDYLDGRYGAIPFVGNFESIFAK
jgi:uncharacterized protein